MRWVLLVFPLAFVWLFVVVPPLVERVFPRLYWGGWRWFGEVYGVKDALLLTLAFLLGVGLGSVLPGLVDVLPYLFIVAGLVALLYAGRSKGRLRRRLYLLGLGCYLAGFGLVAGWAI